MFNHVFSLPFSISVRCIWNRYCFCMQTVSEEHNLNTMYATRLLFFHFWSLKNENAIKIVRFKCSFRYCVRKLVFKLFLFFWMSIDSESELISSKLQSKLLNLKFFLTTIFLFAPKKCINILKRIFNGCSTISSDEFSTMIAIHFLLCLKIKKKLNKKNNTPRRECSTIVLFW